MTSEAPEVPEGGAPPPGSGAGVINPRPPSGESLRSPASAGPWARIKRHKVAEWTLAYAAFAFAALHAATLLSDALQWPHVIVRVITLLLVLWLPIVPILAWYHGVRALKRVGGSELIIIALLLAIGGSLLWRYPNRATDRAEPSTATSTSAAIAQPGSVAAAFNPPAHSIAVLPFLNMSGDPKQEYFSDGITEELLNSLSRLNDLEVTARTSSFSFKGQNVDIPTIAHKLNVGAILEGSVRRDGNTVRITVQLINAVSGFHLWSQTYDRKLTDILKVQTDVATSVAQQLEVKLVGDEAAKIEVGGTKNADAYDAYLRGAQLIVTADSEAKWGATLQWFDRAIMLDPSYAAAYAQRARVLSDIAREAVQTQNDRRRELFQMARQAAERAVALAPNLADAHVVLGWGVRLFGYFDFTGASPEIERAMSLAPGDEYVLRAKAGFEALLGHAQAAQDAIERAVRLDPENYLARADRASLLIMSRRYKEAQLANEDAIALNPAGYYAGDFTASIPLALGQPEVAQRVCETPAAPLDDDFRHICLAVAYHALGKIKEAESELGKFRSLTADTEPVGCAEIYAQWGDKASALLWLTRAERVRAPDLVWLKVDWRLDPIRNERQFKAIEARMHFPP